MQKNTIIDTIKSAGIDRREAEELLAYVIKKDRPFIKSHASTELNKSDIAGFYKLVKKRANNTPMAYLLGYQPFLNHNFKVTPHVLIPRPETEQLVELVLDDTSNKKTGEFDKKLLKGPDMIIVDIGTGSGCIACSLSKRLSRASVIASDVSEKALSVVKYNNRKLSTSVKVIHSNLLEQKLISEIKKQLLVNKRKNLKSQLLIVANLPYLPSSDAKTMQKDVVDYEPHLALFAGKDGLKLIKKLLLQIKNFKKLTESQTLTLWLELDPRQITPLSSYIKKTLPDAKIKVYKDLFGRKRFMRIGF